MERQKSAQQRELEDLYSSKDDVGKNVSSSLVREEPEALRIHFIKDWLETCKTRSFDNSICIDMILKTMSILCF